MICGSGKLPDNNHIVVRIISKMWARICAIFLLMSFLSPTPLVQASSRSSLPSVQFCKPQADGAHWTVEYGDVRGASCTTAPFCDSVRYRCKELAENGPVFFEPIAAADRDIDCAGRPLIMSAFVVDGAAGELRFNASVCHLESGPTLQPNAVLVVFSGSGGTGFRDASGGDGSGTYTGRDPDNDRSASDGDYRALEMNGTRVVGVRWQPGISLHVGFGAISLGWWSRSSPNPSTIKEIAKRPAALLKELVARGVSPTTPFAVAGTSAGSTQAASVLWHDIGRRVDYLGLHSGGGISVSLDNQTGAIPTLTRFHKDTGASCVKGPLCGKDFDDALVCTPVCRMFIDHVHRSSNALAGRWDSRYLASSLAYSSWEGTKPGDVDFLVNSTNDTTPPNSDMALGAVWATAKTRSLVWERWGIIGSYANSPGLHGDVMTSGSPGFMLFKSNLSKAISHALIADARTEEDSSTESFRHKIARALALLDVAQSYAGRFSRITLPGWKNAIRSLLNEMVRSGPPQSSERLSIARDSARRKLTTLLTRARAADKPQLLRYFRRARTSLNALSDHLQSL